MINKHLPGLHNQKTHGRSVMGTDFSKRWHLSLKDAINLEHLNQITWRGNHSIQEFIANLENNGVPVSEFMMDPDYDPKYPGNAPSDAYITLGSKSDPNIFRLDIRGSYNSGTILLTSNDKTFEDLDLYGSQYTEYMKDNAPSTIKKLMPIFKASGFSKVLADNYTVPIVVAAKTNWLITVPPDAKQAYDFLNDKYQLKIPTDQDTGLKAGDPVVNILKVTHKLYPEVSLFSELFIAGYDPDYKQTSASVLMHKDL